MTRELENFKKYSFRKASIGANNVVRITPKNIPNELRKYPQEEVRSYQDWGTVIITEQYRLPKRRI